MPAFTVRLHVGEYSLTVQIVALTKVKLLGSVADTLLVPTPLCVKTILKVSLIGTALTVNVVVTIGLETILSGDALLLIPFSVALMSVEPILLPVAKPVSVMLAIVGLDDCHVTESVMLLVELSE